LLNEPFEAKKDVYKWETYFIYGYLIVSLAMMKWCNPEVRELALVTKDHPLALRYSPWRTSGDPNNKEINKASLTSWYDKMLAATKFIPKIPNFLLDDYSHTIPFSLHHETTWIHPNVVNPDTF